MKAQGFKKILCSGLALVLAAVGLCACGDSTAGENTGSAPVDSGAPITDDAAFIDISGNANAALAKENVYWVSEVEIPQLSGDHSVSVESMARYGDKIYAVMRISDWENGDQYFVLSMGGDGKEIQTVFLTLPEEDEGEEGVEADPDIQEWKDTRYSDFVAGADGKIYALRQYNYSYVNYLTDQSRDEQRQYVCCWDTDGRLLWQSEPGEDNGEALSVWTIFPREDGSLELLLTGENAYRLSMEKDGSLSDSGRQRLSEETGKAFGNCRRLLRREDGSCLLLCRNSEDSLALMEYGLQTDALGEAVKLPDDLPAISLSSTAFSAGMDGGLLYADKQGVFTWRMGEEQGSLKMNYVNSDRNITDVSALLELDETHFLMFYREDYAWELKAGIFTYVEPEDIPDKTVIVLAGIEVNGGIRNRVIQYNRESSRYRVVMKEYNSGEDLNLDIVSGKMPDLLMAEGFPMESYIAKGLIADVGALIEGDEELSQTEFLENVFDAYSVDGKLCYVIPSFTLFTMVAKASLVGDGSGWSMEKALAALDEMGGDARLLDGISRSVFMETVMKYCGNDFIDLETGKCAFDSPEFIAMMEYAYTLPEEQSYAGQSGEWEYELQYLKNRTLLMELHVWSFSQNVDERLFYQLNGYLGGEYTFLDFPAGSAESAEGGNGALICADNLMALSAGSENLEGAWDFARYYLTDEYQESLESSLPVCKSLFEEWAEEETLRPYTIDENGKKAEYDLALYWEGEEVIVPPLSWEQLDQIIAYVESATGTPFEDDTVMNIIHEELGSYFSGQKTAEAAATVIQNRVQMYVQENQ